MFGSRKPADAPVASMDALITTLEPQARDEPTGKAAVDLITLLTARGVLAAREDRAADALADLRAVGHLLRGFDDRPLPVTVATARLASMHLAVAELDAGEHDASLVAAERAAGLMAGLGPDDTELCAGYYSDISALFGIFRGQKRTAEALRAARASQAAAVALASAGSVQFPRVVATAGINVALGLVDCGRVEEALTVIGDVVRRLREAGGPARGLGLALSNQANWLRRLERWDDALVVEQEALALARADAPDAAGQRGLAARLTSLMMTQVRAGRLDEAETTGREALGILLRQPMEEAVAKEQTALASGWNTLCVAFHRAGRLEAAEQAAARTVELQRELTAAPWGDRGALANALSNQADALVGLGDPGRAVELTREALAIFAALGDARFDLYERAALDTLCKAQAALGQREDAVASAARAVDLARGLVTRNPDHRTRLAASLGVLADRLGEAGDASAERTARDEAAAVTDAS